MYLGNTERAMHSMQARQCDAKKAPKPRSRFGERLWARRAEVGVSQVPPSVPSPTSGCEGAVPVSGDAVPVSGDAVPVSGGAVPVSGGAVRGVWEMRSPFQGRVTRFPARGCGLCRVIFGIDAMCACAHHASMKMGREEGPKARELIVGGYFRSRRHVRKRTLRKDENAARRTPEWAPA